MNDSTFIHRYLPGTDVSRHPLLLLHGTGGNEDDLIPVGEMIDPAATILSPRGKVTESGMPRFFRRLAEALRAYGAVMDHRVLETGHGITRNDIDLARGFIAGING